ncbi:hypothetical protein [Campylobacter sp. RM16187]|uniref:hypothetical protein n=1 Tax=Campylobacter sp. RM16187 TaxID=1660063 RepID=UPI0021B6AB7E|nr:hypothetical protein [Campylobacter sp. RM16187]QKG30305.1 hypothetical protein CDOMF_b007 [Campylobacter sp. RM16187]
MEFKKVNISEQSFLNSARGESKERRSKNLKREKSFLVYFTIDEFERVKVEATNLGMGINQYIRFRIFNKQY